MIVNKAKLNIYLILLVILNASFMILIPFDVLGHKNEIFRLIAGFILFIFVTLHGEYRYGWEKIVIFFFITFFITFTFENLSIATGFPFGYYHYSDLLGTTIGHVPIMIMPTYFFTGYLAWTMGNIFLKDIGSGIKKRNIFFIPIVSSFIMVMWNFCFEPIMSTIDGKWSWESKGIYLGVPLSNYIGWFLTMYIIYQLFALFLYKFSVDSKGTQNKTYWYVIPLMFISQGIPYLIHPFIQSSYLNIYWSSFIATIGTMLLISIINLIFIKNIHK